MSRATYNPGMGHVLVVGGGMAGITASLEVAETGCEVTLLEKTAYLGGRVAQMARYFPKLCPPTCGLEINFRRLRQHPRIRCLTLAEIVALEGRPGAFEATIKVEPRYVNERCTACGDCLARCPVERPNDFNQGRSTTRAIYLPHAMTLPLRMTIDPTACVGKTCAQCLPVCRYQAIDLDGKATEMKLNACHVIVATGWKPYDAGKLEGYGFGTYENVITNTMMERLAAIDGPTAGKLLRPSDGKPPRHVTFVQCAGSREDTHLRHCSAVCCLATLKQATYVTDQQKDANVRIFCIDLRTPGRNELFGAKVTAHPAVELVRGKVGRIEELAGSKNLVVHAEDTQRAHRVHLETELVVLATGMEPNGAVGNILGLARNSAGFLVPDRERGIDVAGCARRPSDVATTVEDATGAALRALQSCVRRPTDG